MPFAKKPVRLTGNAAHGHQCSKTLKRKIRERDTVLFKLDTVGLVEDLGKLNSRGPWTSFIKIVSPG